jgi:hypothetical protein
MPEVDNELDQAVDPPNNDGGTKQQAALGADATGAGATAVDPPNNDGGTK